MRLVGRVALWAVTTVAIAGVLGTVAYLVWWTLNELLVHAGAPVLLRALWAMAIGVAWVAATVAALVTVLDE